MATFTLTPHFFDAAQRTCVEHDGLTASLVRNDSGIEILTLSSDRIELTLLPFQGQQIWKAVIDGRDITMVSEVDEPIPTQDYLRNYGAFLVHCGATAMGGPSRDDKHPLHGELPNARYNSAWIETGYDGDTPYIELHGEYKHQIAMTVNYIAHPVIRVTQRSSIVDVSMSVSNESQAPMDFMYLAHMNFFPVHGSKIVGSHSWDSDAVQVRASFPSHIVVDDETQLLLKELEQEPVKSSVVQPSAMYDPEAVMMIRYLEDTHGYAHTLQIHPDGSSDYMKHQPRSAPYSLRCIQMSKHHQCVGFLPSTAGVEGFIAEKQAGRVIEIAPRTSYCVDFAFGALDQQGTQEILSVIDETLARNM